MDLNSAKKKRNNQGIDYFLLSLQGSPFLPLLRHRACAPNRRRLNCLLGSRNNLFGCNDNSTRNIADCQGGTLCRRYRSRLEACRSKHRFSALSDSYYTVLDRNKTAALPLLDIAQNLLSCLFVRFQRGISQK